MQFHGINKRIRAGLHQVFPSLDSFWDAHCTALAATIFNRLPHGWKKNGNNKSAPNRIRYNKRQSLLCVSVFLVEKFFGRN